MFESQESKIRELNRSIASRMDNIGWDKCFGNTELIELQKRKEFAEKELDEMKKTYKKCVECDGDGWVTHECDCEVCSESEEECKDCCGEGVVLK